jgi:hypothetical protein
VENDPHYPGSVSCELDIRKEELNDKNGNTRVVPIRQCVHTQISARSVQRSSAQMLAMNSNGGEGGIMVAMYDL